VGRGFESLLGRKKKASFGKLFCVQGMRTPKVRRRISFGRNTSQSRLNTARVRESAFHGKSRKYIGITY
ncbi:hypothetical protein P363_0125510, partial [Paenibacillus sp. MAEPY1]